jgi:hypothetical protein
MARNMHALRRSGVVERVTIANAFNPLQLLTRDFAIAERGSMGSP